jgi:hypothetical protein
LDVGLDSEPDDVLWLDIVGLVEVVEGFVPGRQVGAGDRVEVAAAVVLGRGVVTELISSGSFLDKRIMKGELGLWEGSDQGRCGVSGCSNTLQAPPRASDTNCAQGDSGYSSRARRYALSP